VIGIERPEYISRLDAKLDGAFDENPDVYACPDVGRGACDTRCRTRHSKHHAWDGYAKRPDRDPPHREHRHLAFQPGTTPLQQQMQQDYATQLRGAQQQLLMQNPSGLTRGEENISNQLNGYTPQ
jgi:hypothetical protein